jgi:DNA-3-methyladenine glycosylase II
MNSSIKALEEYSFYMDASLKILKKDKRFAQLIKTHGKPDFTRPGLGKGNIFQALVRAIVYQQLSGKAALTIYTRFVGLFNKPNTPISKMKFPKPAEVAAMPFEKLRSVGLSGQKATYIHDLANKFADGTIKHKTIHNMTTEEVTAHLTQVKGVGVWTVQMLQIFTLGRLDVLPVGDLGVQKGFQITYKLKKLPTRDQMEQLAKPWREHASVASWYFWRAADAAKIKPTSLKLRGSRKERTPRPVKSGRGARAK